MSTISLQSLQTQIRKDPVSYKEDFILQYRHFESISDSLHLNPGRPSKQYGDLLHFVSHCYPCYPALHADLGLESLIHKTLSKEPERLHQSIRRALVQAALVLRGKGAMDFFRNFERLFLLNAVEDKELRRTLFQGLLSDLGHSTVPNKKLPKGENPSINRKAVQSFLVSVLSNSSSPLGQVRAAAGLLIAAFKKKFWRDSAAANAIAEHVIYSQTDSKTAIAGVYLMLGNMKQAMRISEACEGVDQRDAKAKEEIENENENEPDRKKEQLIDFTAIDLLNDAQSYVERLFEKVSKKEMPFEQRVLLLQLIARLLGRHELLLLNYYPYITKYLKPNHQGVTKLLAAFTEASHPLVPPEDLQVVIKHILEYFVAEHCRPEVIAIGINTLRAMAARAPLAIAADQVQHLCDFRESKNRTVVGAARAILNLYRDKFPELLPKKLRGKVAAIAVTTGNAARPEYGRNEAPLPDLPGIARLENASDDHEEDTPEEGDEVEGEDEEEDEDDEEEEEDDEEQDEDEEGEEDENELSDDQDGEPKMSIAAERVLDDEDFKRMRRKRKTDEMETSDEEEDGGFQATDPNSLAPKRREQWAMTKKQARVATIIEGKTDKTAFKKKERRGGSTNKEKNRNKPMMMATQKRKFQKSQMSANDKAQHLKKHIKNLRKKVGGVQKRRRG